jgi:polysaccharide export outer membrane protein
VTGLVKEPNQYDLPGDRDVRLLEALAMAGGRTSSLADKVWVLRQDPENGQQFVIEASVRGAKQGGADNLLLAPGDLITVEETPSTFVLSLLKNFMRFGLSSSIPLF